MKREGKWAALGCSEKYFLLFLTLIFAIYLAFSFFRPYEDDESLHILAGKAIIEGNLNPFHAAYYKHYSNPFQYVMGSPLIPVIYGAAYTLGGIILTRATAAILVLLSIFIAYKLIRHFNGEAAIPLALIGFSSSTILIASDAYLDAAALFCLMAALWMLCTKRMFFAGILSVLAASSKFILALPAAVMLAYLVYQKKWVKYTAGLLLVAIPFLVLYHELIPIVINFVRVTKIDSGLEGKAGIFAAELLTSLPVAPAIAFLGIKSQKFKEYFLLMIPAITILAYQVVTLDYNSLMRHLPYAQFPAAVIVGVLIKGKQIRYKWLLLAAYAVVSVIVAAAALGDYPSYNMIKDIPHGEKVLAINPHAFMLITGAPINATAEQVFSYYYFNYNNSTAPNLSDYEQALKEEYFDYAFIASYSASMFPRYVEIERLVRKYYCPVLESRKRNSIDIYARCNWETLNNHGETQQYGKG